MADGGLVAPVESTREAWTGSGLADSIEGLVDAVRSDGWVDDALAGLGLGLEVTATVMDPISALLANGIGWAMEYFEPLREILDELTGKPDVVRSHAATWNNMATELYAMSDELGNHLKQDTPDWHGESANAYRALMVNNVEALGGLAAISAAMAAATEGAGGLVEMTREIVRDLIADLVARVIVWVAEAIFVVTIPLIATQIAAAVVKWVGRITTYTLALINSLTNLNKLLNS